MDPFQSLEQAGHIITGVDFRRVNKRTWWILAERSVRVVPCARVLHLHLSDLFLEDWIRIRLDTGMRTARSLSLLASSCPCALLALAGVARIDMQPLPVRCSVGRDDMEESRGRQRAARGTHRAAIRSFCRRDSSAIHKSVPCCHTRKTKQEVSGSATDRSVDRPFRTALSETQSAGSARNARGHMRQGRIDGVVWER